MSRGLHAGRRGAVKPAPVLSSAVAWWKAATYSGSGDLQDGSGNGHHLVITGAAFDTDHFTFVAGESDYMRTADHADLDFAASDSFTVAIAFKVAAPPAAACAWLSKKTSVGTGATNAGYSLQTATSGTGLAFRCCDAAVIPAASKTAALDNDVPLLGAGVRDVTADTLTAYRGSGAGTPVTDTTTATLANTVDFTIGASGSAVPDGFASMTFYGAAVFRRALTAAELATLANELGVPSA